MEDIFLFAIKMSQEHADDIIFMILLFTGFEAGGPNVPSNISPWSIIGNESTISVSTDRSSCFDRNKVALRMDVLCDNEGINVCPTGGVGIYNPGFWGMVSPLREGISFQCFYVGNFLDPYVLKMLNSVSLLRISSKGRHTK